MKTKLLALIISLLCLFVIFAACGNDKPCETHTDADNDSVCDVCGAAIEAETTAATTATTAAPVVVCDEHKDVNADKRCDVCDASIVSMTVIETTQTQARVEMVVNKIPTGAKPEDYIKTELDKNPTYTAGEFKGTITDYFGNIALVRNSVDVVQGATTYTYYEYKVIDVVANKVIVDAGSTSVKDYGINSKTVRVTLGANYITVETIVYDITTVPTKAIKYEKAYYTYTGNIIGEAYSWHPTEDEPTYSAPTAPSLYYSDSNFKYFRYEAVTYVVDIKTDKIVYTEDSITIVTRPDMDGVQGNYGYVKSNSKVMVYDLTKWIECVYTYDIPSNAIGARAFQLANSDILVQYIVALPSTAVSYDYIQNDVKYDIVYTMIDVRNKTAKNVEFGYYITNVSVNDGSFTMYTDKVENLFTVYTVNNVVNTNDEKVLVVGNDLSVLIEMKLHGNVQLKEKGLYIRRVYFNDTDSAYELVDINGNHKAYIDLSVTVAEGYKKYDWEPYKFYDYNNKLIIDVRDTVLAGKVNVNFSVSAEREDFWLIKSVTPAAQLGDPNVVTFYYYAVGSDKVVDISKGKENFALVGAYNFGFVVSYTVESGSTTKTVYELYDANNVKLATSTANFTHNTYNDVFTADGEIVYFVRTTERVTTISGTEYVTTTYRVK